MKKLLIIGASRGIGLEFARQYAADGASVTATYRKPHDAARIGAVGAQPLALDVTDAGAIAALGRQLDGAALDAVVINAGLYGPRTQGIEAVTQADFDAVMRTNVLATMQLLPVLAPALTQARGKLAVISSAMGQEPDHAAVRLAVPRQQGGAEHGGEGGKPGTRRAGRGVHGVSPRLGAHRHGRRRRGPRRGHQRGRHAPRD